MSVRMDGHSGAVSSAAWSTDGEYFMDRPALGRASKKKRKTASQAPRKARATKSS